MALRGTAKRHICFVVIIKEIQFRLAEIAVPDQLRPIIGARANDLMRQGGNEDKCFHYR